MIKDISFLYSKTVTTKDNELIQNYINELSESERDNFSLIVNDLITANLKITHNAIKLALKVYNDANVKVFPCVFKSACKGSSVRDGSYSFFMYLLDNKVDNKECGNIINSYYKVKTLLLKNCKVAVKIVGYSVPYDVIIDIDK
jgi:hypothetical protein